VHRQQQAVSRLTQRRKARLYTLSLLVVYAWLLEILQRGLPGLHQGRGRRIGLGGDLQQATLLHDGRETQEQRLIGTEQFTNQYEAE
jgi:hypothetical protein